MLFSAHALLLGAWGLLQALSVAGVIGYWWYLPRQPATEVAEGVVAIVPVKGPAPDIARFSAALLAQSAPLRAMFVVQSTDDPAWATLAALAARHADRLELIVAGLAVDEGQKIHNLLAAIARLNADDRILVFLDADMVPSPNVVGRLLFPLVRGKAAISTGYRWLVPAANAPATWLGAAINLQLATCPRLVGWNLPWGGATALTRGTFDRLDLAQVWRGALLDDLELLMRAARRQRVAIRTVADLLLPSSGEATLAGLWRFGTRQYQHVFWNARPFWMLAAAILGIQAVGWAWALCAGGWTALLIGYGAAWLRAGFRVLTARRLPQTGQLRPVLSVAADAAAPFLVCWVHLLMILGGAGARISWGGVDYWMSRGKVKYMRRH